MSDTREVISAFLDDEPFDPGSLAQALGEPGGRDLLMDLVALRHLVQPDGRETPALAGRSPRRVLPALVAAAAILVALVGGYVAGARRSEELSAAPPATRVVQAPAAWQVVPPGRMQ